MKLLKITLISTFCLFLFNCKSAFVHKDFNAKTATHKKIAILPFKIIITGNLPKNLSNEEIKEQQEAEAELFQTSLINQLLRKDAQRKSKNMNVEILSKESTNGMLKEMGYSISEITNMNPSKLANLLNVDAVVSSSVKKHRYMSNDASFGIAVGTSILRRFGVDIDLKNNTNDIYITSDIIDKKDKSTLFNISKTVKINWKSDANDIVNDVNRKITRNFPYLK